MTKEARDKIAGGLQEAAIIAPYLARIAELEAALKPFADKATVYPDLPDNWVAHVTMKHLRAARAAYL